MLIPVDIDAWDVHLMHDLCVALTARNVRILRAGGVPALWDAGVRYQQDPPSEPLFDVARVRARGAGDCEDLASWRAAELQVWGWRVVAEGDPAWRMPVNLSTATVGFLDYGHEQYHAVVTIARTDTDGLVIDDPSARLGMRGAIDPLILRRWR